MATLWPVCPASCPSLRSRPHVHIWLSIQGPVRMASTSLSLSQGAFFLLATSTPKTCPNRCKRHGKVLTIHCKQMNVAMHQIGTCDSMQRQYFKSCVNRCPGSVSHSQGSTALHWYLSFPGLCFSVKLHYISPEGFKRKDPRTNRSP